ncbi:ParB/RepB/Spo0J family partition protein [Acidithiobacillus sp. YTS05]|nr:ParB/RepB/Spo0J family partition protein [Acidithiobacillus sp. YTS05]
MKDSVLKGLNLDRAKAALQSKPEDLGKPSLVALYLPLDAIMPDPDQPRRSVEGGEGGDQSLEDLAASILQHGVIQPITVEAVEKGKYQIIAGERRWRAAKKALESGQACARKGYDLQRIPAVILQSESPTDRMEMQLVENLARSDMRNEDVAQALQTLLETLKVSKAELARRLGRSPSWVDQVLAKGSEDARQIAKQIGLSLETIGGRELQRMILWKKDPTRSSLLELVANALQTGIPFSRGLLDEMETRHILEGRFPELRGRKLPIEDLQFVADHIQNSDPVKQYRAQRILDGEPEPLERPLPERATEPVVQQEPKTPKVREDVGAESGADELETNAGVVRDPEIESQDYEEEGEKDPGSSPVPLEEEDSYPIRPEAAMVEGASEEIPEVPQSHASVAPSVGVSTLSVPIPIALVERIFDCAGMSCDLSAVDARAVVTALEKLISG